MGANNFCQAKRVRPEEEKEGRVESTLCCIPGELLPVLEKGNVEGERGTSSSPDFPRLGPKVTGRGSTSTLQLLAASCQGQMCVLPVEGGLTVLWIILYRLCTWGYSTPF